MISTPSALLVGQSVHDLLPVVSFLGGHGFHVTVADNFRHAKSRINERPPRLLITEVCLGEYNGLELVLRAKLRHPDTAAVVLSRTADPVLQADADAMQATFVCGRFTNEDLHAAIFRTLFASGNDSKAFPIRPPFERRRTGDGATVQLRVDDQTVIDRRRSVTALVESIRPAPGLVSR